MPDVVDDPQQAIADESILSQGDYEADQDLQNLPLPQGNRVPRGTLTAQSSAVSPPTWSQVKSSPLFDKMLPEGRQVLFQKWVQDSDNFLAKVNTPRADISSFDSYITKQGRDMGIAFIYGSDGRPKSYAEASNAAGRDIRQFSGDNPNLPATIPIQNNTSFLRELQNDATGAGKELYQLFVKPYGEAASVWNHFTGTKYGTDALDKGLEKADIEGKIFDASLVDENGKMPLGVRFNESAANFGGILLGGARGSPIGSLIRMGTLASAEAADDTYHNAIERGATPLQAAASSGVAATVNGGIFALFGPLGKFTAGASMGPNAVNFLNGLYRPTVKEAAKLIGLDAAGQYGLGASGTILQNEADKAIYDPNRPALEGANDAGLQQSFFALMHAPTLVKALWDNRNAITSARTRALNARDILNSALKEGDKNKVDLAKKDFDTSNKAYNDIIEKTSQDAPLPTLSDAKEAGKIVFNPEESSSQNAPISESNPPVNPLEDLTSSLEREVNTPIEGEAIPSSGQSDITKGVHPVFGEGEYKPQDLLGSMTTSDIAPSVQQLFWNRLATDRVRRQVTNDKGEMEWQYDLATPNERQNEHFQRPQLTRDTLGQQDALQQTKALTDAARAIGPATTEEVKQNGEINQTVPGQGEPGESRPLLDETQLGEEPATSNGGEGGSLGPGQSGGQDDQARLSTSQQNGEGSSARTPEAHASGNVSEGGGEISTPPPAPATYLGMQEIPNRPSFKLYNLTEDIPGHPKGSTVSEQTLKDAGYSLPDEKTTVSNAEQTQAQSKSSQTGEETSGVAGISESPNPSREGFVEDNDVHLDPRYEDLTLDHKLIVDKLADAVRKSGVKGVRIQLTDSDTGIFTDAFHEGDTIFINPESLKHLADHADFWRLAAREENLHNSVISAWKRMGLNAKQAISRIFKEMDPKSIAQVLREYKGILKEYEGKAKDEIDARGQLGIVMEYLRILQQRRAGEKTTERQLYSSRKFQDSSQTKSILANSGEHPAIEETLLQAEKIDKERLEGLSSSHAQDRGQNQQQRIPETLGADLQPAIEQPLQSGETGQRPQSTSNRFEDISSNGRINVEHPNIEGFYSELSRVIDEKMPNRANGDQVRAMLKGNGIKDDELKWSGVDDYLREYPKATKTDLQQFLKEEGGIKIQAHNIGVVSKKLPEGWDIIQNKSGNGGWTHAITDDLGNVRVHGNSREEALEKGLQSADAYQGQGQRYAQYQLPGGENYREQVFSLPSKEGGNNYTSSHFPDVPNYLAHMRLNDRADADGNLGTFIEEMQSDRHQQGRERGYSENNFDREKIRDDRQKNIDQWMSYREEMKSKYGPTYGIAGKVDAEEREKLAEFSRKESNFRDVLARSENAPDLIPDAPFRKTWHEFLFRKALNDAVASGKKWIGWTTGETQADRYDLSKQVDSVKVRKRQDGTYNIGVTKKDESGYTPIKEVATEEELPHLIGKDLANKVIQQEIGPVKSYEGADLKVGGEGMKGFYDGILPQYVAKYAKKWGVKPEMASLDTPAISKKERIEQLRDSLNAGYGSDYWSGLTQAERNEHIQEAPGISKSEEASTRQIWKLPINEEMRKSVQERGQPIFIELPPEIPEKSRGLWEATKSLALSLKNDVRGIKKFDDWAKAKNGFSSDLSKNVQEVGRVISFVKRSVPDSVRRDAISNYIEAKGDAKVLQERANLTKDKTLKSGYEAALNLTDQEKAIAAHVRKTFDLYQQLATKWGIDVAKVENYVPHIWAEGLEDNLRNASGRSLRTSFRHANQRTLESYFTGEQLGFKSVTKDIASLLGSYVNDLNYAISSRKFIKGLTDGKASDGRPLVGFKLGALNHLPTDGEKKQTVLVNRGNVGEDHSDYRDDKLLGPLAGWTFKGILDGKTVFGKDSMAVHPEIYDQVRHIFDRSALKEWWESPSEGTLGRFGKGLVKGAFTLNTKGKTTLFGVVPSLFHPVQIMNEAISHRTVPLSAAEYIKEPDLSDPAIKDKADHGLMLAPNQSSRQLFMDGMDQANQNLIFDVAKLLDAIPGGNEIKKQTFDRLNQGTEVVQKWIFETYIPSLKNRFYDIVLERNQQRFAKELGSGKVTLDDLKYLTARTANNAFGHLNYVDIARNPTMQHMMQFAFLAPDFFEARIRHTGQALQGLLGGKGGWEQSTALAAMGSAMFIASRLVNAWLNDGDPKWDYPFAIIYGNKIYGMRTQVGDLYKLIGVPWQNGHFAWQGMFQNWRSWISGREAPMTRFALEALTGVNYRGEATSTSDAIRDALVGNFPISLQPIVRPIANQMPKGWKEFLVPSTVLNNPISPFEQFLQSTGIQVSRYSPISRTYQLAGQWKNEHGKEFDIPIERGSYPTSQYTPLRYALEDGDYGKAGELYQQLVAEKKSELKVNQGFKESLNRPFTGGSQAAERAFVNSLNEQDKQVYEAAIARRQLLLQRLTQAREQMVKK